MPRPCGRRFDPSTLTAAHPSHPFGSKVEVENLDNGLTVILEIDDRGPFTQGRIIDVSRALRRDGKAGKQVPAAQGATRSSRTMEPMRTSRRSSQPATAGSVRAMASAITKSIGMFIQ